MCASASESESDNMESDIEDEKCMELVIRCPFTMTVAGPTKSGKTTFINKLIENSNSLFSIKPNKIFYFFNSVAPKNHDVLRKRVHKFYDGMPTMNWLESAYKKHGDNIVVVIDDQDLSLNKDLAMIFNVGSSHFKANLIFVTHNIFNKQSEAREMSLNSDYYVLMKQIRDKTQIKRFFHQHHPSNPQAAMDVYLDATKEPYSYLLMDFHQETPDGLRMITNIFCEKGQTPFVYEIPS